MTAALILAAALSVPSFSAVPDTALLTYESGALVAADWIQRRGRHIRSLSVLMQSGIRDATIEMNSDGNALRSSTIVSNAGEAPREPIERTFGDGLIYWSDQMTSSVVHAVLRAKTLGQPTARIAATSLYRDSRTEVVVERIDPDDWVVTCNDKRYVVLTDDDGNMLSATLPEYGVTIERRVGFKPADYPMWSANSAAPGAKYRAEEVRIPAPQGHVLAGTLTLPPGPGPFPAAVLITGLSPSNRNGGDPPWMPLRDIADALSRNGIIVLRVDDRGVGKSTGDHAPSTTFDEVDDVHTEVGWLRAHRGVDRRKVMLVGYSEGGLIAPMVASTDTAIAGIVTLAGPGVPGPEVARYQIEAAVVRDTSIAPSAREAEIQRQLADSLTARERSYLSIDPLEYARRVRCPALILQGATDLHVPLRSAERLAWAMRSGGNRDVSVRVFPGISHSFLPDPVGLNSRWVALPGFMTSPQALQAIIEWMSRRAG
jgi:pimeloyl-ACP methyl ester carboxylesterase